MFVAKRQMSKRQKLPFCSCRICRAPEDFFPNLLDRLNHNGEWVLYIGQLLTRKLSRLNGNSDQETLWKLLKIHQMTIAKTHFLTRKLEGNSCKESGNLETLIRKESEEES